MPLERAQMPSGLINYAAPASYIGWALERLKTPVENESPAPDPGLTVTGRVRVCVDARDKKCKDGDK